MIVGVCGLIGSGKGTVADILVESHGYVKVSFADSLKDAVSAVFGWDRALLEGDTTASREFRETVDEFWSQRLNRQGVTPRLVLQLVGTEVFRDAFDSAIWVHSLERKLRELPPSAKIVIPDTRFPNEIDMIRRQNGVVWCVQRGELPHWATEYMRSGIEPNHIHPSEYSWLQSRFDNTIHNNENITALEHKVRTLLAK